jgi:hypothetical protein
MLLCRVRLRCPLPFRERMICWSCGHRDWPCDLSLIRRGTVKQQIVVIEVGIVTAYPGDAEPEFAESGKFLEVDAEHVHYDG